MTAPNNLIGLLAPLIALQRLLARFDNQGIIIGGVAASLLGKPRLTADVDAVMLVSTDDLPRLIEAAEQEGFAPRIAPKICWISRPSSPAIPTWIGSASAIGCASLPRRSTCPNCGTTSPGGYRPSTS